MKNKEFDKLSREELLELIEIYAKNWLAMDGVWFQSIEKKYGMDEAIEHDKNAWEKFTQIEAKRIKAFLGLPERAGIDGLKEALAYRIYASINSHEITINDNQLIFRTMDCRAQNARVRKGMGMHPCKPVGIIEYTYFAKVIDDRFECEAISCYPDITDTSCNCAWRFTLIDK